MLNGSQKTGYRASSTMKYDDGVDGNKGAFRWGIRHTQSLLLFTGVAITYMLRVSLSVAIVAMTDNSRSNNNFKKFSWGESKKSMILSSFFWSYALTQMFFGQMVQKYGAKHFLTGSFVTSSILTIVIPACAIYGGIVAMCVNEIIQGLAQGVVFPAVNVLLSKWAPMTEKYHLSSIVFSGVHFGMMITFPLSGHLASSAYGWSSVFYTTGFVTLIWVVCWCFMGANSPAEHLSITKAEREYIVNSLKSTTSKKPLPTPWRDVFTSVPVWTLIVVHSAQNWGFTILLTNMPNYLNHVLKIDIKLNGYLTALPYFLMWILIVTFSWISIHISARGLMSKTNQRKMWNSVAHWGGALAFFSLYIFDTSVTVTIVLLTVAIATNSGVTTGFYTNHLDLAPNFAGTLMGLTNSISCSTAIMGPLLVGFIVKDSSDKDQWGVVFLWSACIYFTGNLFYVLFGSAEIQPWNNPKKYNNIPKRHDEETPMNL